MCVHPCQYKASAFLLATILAIYAAFVMSYLALLYWQRDRILQIDHESLSLRHATLYDPQLKPLLYVGLYQYEVETSLSTSKKG